MSKFLQPLTIPLKKKFKTGIRLICTDLFVDSVAITNNIIGLTFSFFCYSKRCVWNWRWSFVKWDKINHEKRMVGYSRETLEKLTLYLNAWMFMWLNAITFLKTIGENRFLHNLGYPLVTNDWFGFTGLNGAPKLLSPTNSHISQYIYPRLLTAADHPSLCPAHTDTMAGSA